jgi:hypothetical protein
MAPPRYFVPRPGAVAQVRPLGGVAFALDVFAIEPAAAPPEEWLIGLDDSGQLTAQRTGPEAADLLPLVRDAVAFNEVSKGNVRALAQESLYALELSAFEATPDAPTADDPVYLHGALVGALAPGCREAPRIEGKLVVSRGDLLQGLVAGAEHSFLHQDRVAERTARTVHLLLPGDRAEVLAGGRGAVLAYPVCGPDTEEVGPGNEALVAEMLHDLLAATGGLDGDPARARASGGLLWFMGRGRRKRSHDASVDELLSRAREELNRLPDWPDPRARALLARLRPRITPPRDVAALPPPEPTPAPTVGPAARVAPDSIDRLVDGYDEPTEEPSSFAALLKEATRRQRAPAAALTMVPPVAATNPGKPDARPFASVALEGSMVTAELAGHLFLPSAGLSLYIQASIRSAPATLVESTVRTVVETLAVKDHTGRVRTGYFACGPHGMELEPVGQLERESASRYSFRMPGEHERSARLVPAMHDFASQLRYRSSLRGACAIFLVDGDVGDVGEIVPYSEGLGDAVAAHELPRLGFVLVSLSEDTNDQVRRIVSRVRGRGSGRWPLWKARTAEEVHLVPDVMTSAVDEITDGVQGATILDGDGNVLRTYPGRPPRVLTFQLPLHAREFVLLLGDERYVEPVGPR